MIWNEISTSLHRRLKMKFIEIKDPRCRWNEVNWSEIHEISWNNVLNHLCRPRSGRYKCVYTPCQYRDQGSQDYRYVSHVSDCVHTGVFSPLVVGLWPYTGSLDSLTWFKSPSSSSSSFSRPGQSLSSSSSSFTDSPTLPESIIPVMSTSESVVNVAVVSTTITGTEPELFSCLCPYCIPSRVSPNQKWFQQFQQLLQLLQLFHESLQMKFNETHGSCQLLKWNELKYTFFMKFSWIFHDEIWVPKWNPSPETSQCVRIFVLFSKKKNSVENPREKERTTICLLFGKKRGHLSVFFPSFLSLASLTLVDQLLFLLLHLSYFLITLLQLHMMCVHFEKS